MESNAMDLNESFHQLEEKLSKVGEAFKRVFAEKRDIEKAFEMLKHDTGHSQERLETLQNEIKVLRREREEVRIRIEKLLKQLEQLADQDGRG